MTFPERGNSMLVDLKEIRGSHVSGIENRQAWLGVEWHVIRREMWGRENGRILSYCLCEVQGKFINEERFTMSGEEIKLVATGEWA